MKNIHIFLGPTLDKNIAKSIIPFAKYFPPIKHGDLIKSLLDKPDVILIIDGYFENVPAVWHKEILFALQRKVVVIGASSMGALRASELHQLGMIGIGEIFKCYKNGSINDDDEVAVFHFNENNNYIPISDAMINIRFTITNAINKNKITKEAGQKLLRYFKDKYYIDRNFSELKSIYLNNDFRTLDIDWLLSNFIDQKKEDAITALKYLENIDLSKLKFSTINFNFSSSINAIIKNQQCTTLSLKDDFGVLYRRLGMLMYYFNTISNIMFCTNQKIEIILSHLYNIICDKENTNSLIELNKLLNCLHNKNLFFRAHQLLTLLGVTNILNPLLFDDCHQEEIITYFKSDYKREFYSVILHTICWEHLKNYLDIDVTKINKIYLQNYTNKFRKSFKLETVTKTNEWLEQNNLSQKEFEIMMRDACLFKYFVIDGNIEQILPTSLIMKDWTQYAVELCEKLCIINEQDWKVFAQ